MLIYIVEDNENVREALAGYLKLEGFDVDELGGIVDARTAIAKARPDLIVLDVMLPDGNGFMFAKELRKELDTPILFLTARDQESDRVTGLEIGADDYVVKPFSPKEVVLRIRGILRRARGDAAVETRPQSFGLNGRVLRIDADAHRLAVDGTDVSLTAAEWNIVAYLAERAPRVFSRLQLLENCLGSIAEGSERTVDTHVKNIRRKLLDDGWVETVRGFGYRFGGAPQ